MKIHLCDYMQRFNNETMQTLILEAIKDDIWTLRHYIGINCTISPQIWYCPFCGQKL